MKVPRIIIAAPRSGSGKTVLTISLMKALLQNGKNVSAFKCGPDYIDPMFHKKILGVDSRNLDLFFTDEEKNRALFLKNNKCDISVIEGVMGLYDGVGGVTDQASTYHLARTLKAPVILVLDAKGMSRSILAEAAGFLSMDQNKLIKGIILNNMSASLFQPVKELIQENLNVSVIGYFPHQKDCDISSRYLGLALPDEIKDLQEKITKSAETFSKTVDIKKILEIAENAEDLDSQFVFPAKQKPKTRIAVAYDEAFNFYYRDNLELLENNGAELVYFSPVHDKKLPSDIGGLLLGGGYPELCAKELSANKTMAQSIKEEIQKGLPIWAECGGFIYLHQLLDLQDDEKKYAFCGVINGKCFQTQKLVRFGYITLNELNIKAHEFHYFESENNGSLCTAEKPYTGKQWKCGHNINGGFQGFPHLYYPSNISYAEKIVETCAGYKKIDIRNYK
ncbi:MAG: cobyrinate a,c-diamide synthase [Treponemataceae bacterium]|nr:cobyrinate a,c-diamide synthase [Treponemataceae bacterium]